MRRAIAVFAKTIGLSPVKTRLAVTIGEEKAAEFYALSVACIEAVVKRAMEVRPEQVNPVWAMAEENSPRLYSKEGLPAIWTGEGGLGTRLANIHDQLRADHEVVMMIGTDSPQLSANTILRALDRLDDNGVDAVSGPAVDGGYFLFASKRPVPRDIWEAVTYSASTTLAEFEALLKSDGFSLSRIEVMQDVDEADDLASLKAYFEEQTSALLPEQTRLLEWLREHA